MADTAIDLATFAGEICRYRRVAGGTWILLRIKGVNPDGSLDLIEINSGKNRCMHPDRLELQTRGPRKGIHWVPFPTN